MFYNFNAICREFSAGVKIAIVGSGIAGLMLAGALGAKYKDEHMSISVFERADSNRDEVQFEIIICAPVTLCTCKF